MANATCDLLMMAAWSIVSDSVEGCEVVPVSLSSSFLPSLLLTLRQAYYFARDDRVYNAFVERTHAHRVAIAKLPNKRLKWQLRVLEKVGEGRRITYKRKVETLREEFDAGVQI